MTLDDKAYAMFKASPHVWFGARELQDHLGICGWRTRVSTARRRGLNIQNKVLLTHDKRKLSFYQYVPDERTDAAAGTGTESPHLAQAGV